MQAFSVLGTFLEIQTAARIPEGISFACNSEYLQIYVFVSVCLCMCIFRDLESGLSKTRVSGLVSIIGIFACTMRHHGSRSVHLVRALHV